MSYGDPLLDRMVRVALDAAARRPADLVLNHTAKEHAWARGWAAG